jgi:hypothetical protein
MAVVQGIKEKVHLPIYDSILVPPREQLRDIEKSSILKFFVNVQNKTKLETNLQSASLLPHYNTFEARAMRVVISDLPPTFSDKVVAEAEDFSVTDDEGNDMDKSGNVSTGTTTVTPVEADVAIPLDRLIELLKEAKEDSEGFASLAIDDPEIVPELRDGPGGSPLPDTGTDSRETVDDAGGVILLSKSEIQSLIDDLKDAERPLKEQIDPTNGSGTLIGKIVFNTVTSLYVGEKIMIQVPTFFFPGGAGPYSEAAKVTTHGEPSPLATFKFAEPIYIDRQQNFRVEIETPDSEVMRELQRIYGPFYIWVFLDGYMTRDVQ